MYIRTWKVKLKVNPEGRIIFNLTGYSLCNADTLQPAIRLLQP